VPPCRLLLVKNVKEIGEKMEKGGSPEVQQAKVGTQGVSGQGVQYYVRLSHS